MQRSDITASPRENPLTGTITPVKETPYSSGEWKVVECQETGMVYLENPPDYSRLVEEFAWEKTYEEESKRRRQEEPVVAFASGLSKSLKRRFRKRELRKRCPSVCLTRLPVNGRPGRRLCTLTSDADRVKTLT